MSRKYKISELIMNNEEVFYEESEKLKNFRKVKKIQERNKTKYLTWVDDKNITSITTPEGRELTPEELFDFIIGDNIKDLARTPNIDQNKADIGIVLGNIEMPVTRERAIKGFELYKLGIVKKLIFSGGIPEKRDVKGNMHPTSIEDYKDNSELDLEWNDLPEANWGAETFIPDVFDKDYKKHSVKITKEFLDSIGVKPEDVIVETMSKSTQENAEFCKNIFDLEEIETGNKIKSAIIVTTCTHGSRAMRQFQKLYNGRIDLRWTPSTLDLEKYESLKNILHSHKFDEDAFRKELKRIYCTTPELIKKLREETANHRNAFILGDIDDATITTIDRNYKEEDLEI